MIITCSYCGETFDKEISCVCPYCSTVPYTEMSSGFLAEKKEPAAENIWTLIFLLGCFAAFCIYEMVAIYQIFKTF